MRWRLRRPGNSNCRRLGVESLAALALQPSPFRNTRRKSTARRSMKSSATRLDTSLVRFKKVFAWLRAVSGAALDLCGPSRLTGKRGVCVTRLMPSGLGLGNLVGKRISIEIGTLSALKCARIICKARVETRAQVRVHDPSCEFMLLLARICACFVCWPRAWCLCRRIFCSGLCAASCWLHSYACNDILA